MHNIADKYALALMAAYCGYDAGKYCNVADGRNVAAKRSLWVQSPYNKIIVARADTNGQHEFVLPDALFPGHSVFKTTTQIFYIIRLQNDLPAILTHWTNNTN